MASNVEECGYDEFFTTEVPDELKCVICHLVLREPVQIMTCGHRFCSLCFNRMKVSAEGSNTVLTCPVDREAVLHGHVFPDRAASRTIGNLKVHCGNRDQGCPWVDDLRDLKDHEESCQFKINVGMEEMVIRSAKDHTDAVIKQMLSRLLSCENELAKKDKDTTNLRFTLDQLKEDNTIKEDEIKMLKLSVEELKTDARRKDEKLKVLNESIDAVQKELQSTKHSHGQIQQSLNELRSSRITIESQINELKQTESLQTQIATVRRDIEKKIEQTNQTIEKTNQTIITLSRSLENIECGLFAKQIDYGFGIYKDTMEFKWVMQDYLHMFRIGTPVLSPIFHPKVGGYSFQLYVNWTGPNKGKMGLFLKLHRGKTPHRFLKDFNYEFILRVHGKDGGVEEACFDEDDILKFKKDCLTIKKGADFPSSAVGSTSILTAPYDNFIINDSLQMSLTVTI